MFEERRPPVGGPDRAGRPTDPSGWRKEGAGMSTLLYIESSPRKDRSESIAVAREFLDAYAASHGSDSIETIDLWGLALPEFDGYTINAKYKILHGDEHDASEAKAWTTVVDLFQQFNRADKYLFSLPMWNFGLPYKLKHYLDVIIQPGLAFSFSPSEGYHGLVTGKPAVVVYARGGEYQGSAEAAAMDFQKPYFEMLLQFMGFTTIRPIVVEPTLGAPDIAEQARLGAKDLARKIAHEV
jgi:FMN-dependent NADH-azoreductase